VRSRLLVNSPGLRRLRFSFFNIHLSKSKNRQKLAQLPPPGKDYPQVENKQIFHRFKSRGEALLLFQNWLPAVNDRRWTTMSSRAARLF